MTQKELKKVIAKKAIQFLLREGHDVGSIATVQVFESKDNEWMVEVYDPLDEDGTSLHNDEDFTTFVNANLDRHKDIGCKTFNKLEDAVDLYLFIVERMRNENLPDSQ